MKKKDKIKELSAQVAQLRQELSDMRATVNHAGSSTTPVTKTSSANSIGPSRNKHGRTYEEEIEFRTQVFGAPD